MGAKKKKKRLLLLSIQVQEHFYKSISPDANLSCIDRPQCNCLFRAYHQQNAGMTISDGTYGDY